MSKERISCKGMYENFAKIIFVLYQEFNFALEDVFLEIECKATSRGPF